MSGFMQVKEAPITPVPSHSCGPEAAITLLPQASVRAQMSFKSLLTGLSWTRIGFLLHSLPRPCSNTRRHPGPDPVDLPAAAGDGAPTRSIASLGQHRAERKRPTSGA